MRPACVPVALLALLGATGCGYVHFGRLPAAAVSDARMAEAYSNLATEHKMLKQELALARREGDTLRAALERGGAGGSATGDLVARLNEAARDLATLRASHARLQAERAATGAAAVTPPPGTAAGAENEERLAAALRQHTQLQEENSRLRSAVDAARAENAALQDRLQSAATQAERMQASVAQLNTELLAQKEARQRAEQAATAVRTQLETVLAHGRAAAGTAREPAATGPTSLQIAKAPPAESSATVELRMNTEPLRTAGPAASRPPRVHVVRPGDTPESLAREYFGAPEHWPAIHEANRSQLGSGQPLRVGMELQIPAR